MAKDFSLMEDSNRSSNPSIHDVSDPSRRQVLRGGLGALASSFLAPLSAVGAAAALTGCASMGKVAAAKIGFKSVAISTADSITVPEGYIAHVIAPWGDPVGIVGQNNPFKDDASNSASEQETQLGMHHDGIHFYALDGSRRGLLAMNHEYVDHGLLFKDGMANWSAEKVRKSQAAHGVSVVEVQEKGGKWEVVNPSKYARRITANTRIELSGPAAGHALMKTAADPSGKVVLGTLNNCASGITPWGTYLTSEENFIFYFSGGDKMSEHERRWGLRKGGVRYRWHEHDARFDAVQNPNEPNRFGWIVEIDPQNPNATPMKRTAMGRGAHEGATIAVTKDKRAVVYMGEDARLEYIYKFVSRDAIKPGGASANATLLDHGTLYVAKFNEDGKGQWIALTHGQGPLTAANGFADQAEVLIKARQASDLLGATKMDRPEWIDIDKQGWVYATLTNNSDRGGSNQPGVDAANPRANNTQGNIIRWKEDVDFHATTFAWNHFIMAGDPSLARPEAKGNIKGDMFSCPDGLWVDGRGLMWIQTDMSTSAMGKGDLKNFGNNMMLAADVLTGEVRRFLVGPAGCEVTGVTETPDGRTMFVNIQHPGETPSELNNPANPRAISNWPEQKPTGRPRSATVVIRKQDGGIIGT
jgi:secreted PhoX family phosphatase